ncbi:hypothetical protein SAMN04488242_2863 [Tessaracoccus oleiagri]|uniref:Uncharacterized protein n=2 Tax=Tessaracoccus oleiagri TaxID=686624 RepID=A0A1G9N1D0_9ACTN|nr:hypothetical protein SAMN04488242_2863 [Tessaracoccus oleiagri]
MVGSARFALLGLAAACAYVLGACAGGDVDPVPYASTPAAAPSSTASGPATSPPPTTSMQPIGCPYDHGGTCLFELEPGTYTTTTFEPSITYTVPEGWVNAEDLPGNFLLHLDADDQLGGAGGSYLGIYRNAHAAAISCVEDAQEGVGTSSRELAEWFTSLEMIEVSEPQLVSVGGLDGLQVDISQVPGAEPCTFGGGVSTPLIIGDGKVSDLHHVVSAEIDVRLVILDHEDGNVTLEITNVLEQHPTQEYRAIVQPIVDSLAFGV